MPENDRTREEMEHQQDEASLNPDRFDIGTFRQLMDDVRMAHQHELDSYLGKKEMGWRIVQFNGVVGTIAVALLTQIEVTTSVDSWVLALIVGGGLLLVISTIVGMIVQRPDSMKTGPSKAWIDEIRQGGIPEVEYLAVHARRLNQARREIFQSTGRRTLESGIAMVLSLCGLILFLSGTLALHVL